MIKAQYFTGEGVSAATRASLKGTKYTEEEYISASKSIASYTITFVLYEMHMAVEQMVKRLRGHRLDSFRGFKRELNRLMEYEKQRMVNERISYGDKADRIGVMCPCIHEDMEDNLNKMYYTTLNWYHRYLHPEAEILASAQLAQIVADFAVNIIKYRVAEIRRMVPTWAPNLEHVMPTKTKQMIEAVMDRIVRLTGDCGDDADINQCRELIYGIHVMEEIVSDVDRMELYTAYGIEMTQGREFLKESFPSAYYVLHPMEDPEYLAEKEARALAEMEAEERRNADKLAYTTADIERAEAKDGMTLEEMFVRKGWNVKNTV